jgi:hypothetical protein
LPDRFHGFQPWRMLDGMGDACEFCANEKVAQNMRSMTRRPWKRWLHSDSGIEMTAKRVKEAYGRTGMAGRRLLKNELFDMAVGIVANGLLAAGGANWLGWRLDNSLELVGED